MSIKLVLHKFMCPLLWDNIFKNSHGVQGEMKKRVLNARLKLWYMICFMFFGLIDQRRGSAVGEIQMIFSNLTGIVVALLLLPSLYCCMELFDYLHGKGKKKLRFCC